MSDGRYGFGDGITTLSSLPLYGGSGYAFTGLTSQYTRGDGTYAIFPTNISSFTNDSNYLTSSAASSTYVPYTGATSNVNLGTFNITAKTGTFINGIINSGATATGFYIETDNSGNQLPFIINSLSGANSDAILQGVNNSRLIVKNVTSTQRWFIGNDVTNDSFYISSSPNPSSSQINFYLNGNINMGNATATNQRLVRIGQDTSNVDIGSLVGNTALGALYLTQTTPDGTNYALTGVNNGATYLNSKTVVYTTVNTSAVQSYNGYQSKWTGGTFTGSLSGEGAFMIVAGNSSSLATGTEINNFQIASHTWTWAAGALATQKFNVIKSPTVAFASVSTATNVYSLYVEAATAGTNCTINNNYAAGFGGNVKLTSSTTLLQVHSTTATDFSTKLQFTNSITGLTSNAGTFMALANGVDFYFNQQQSTGRVIWKINSGDRMLLLPDGAVRLGGSNTNGSTGAGSAFIIDANKNLICGYAAIATNATDGFLYLPSCAGVPTGVPTSVTGKIPIVIDSTNNKAYIYSGGSWVALN